MKKDLAIHLFTFAVFFVIVTLFQQWFRPVFIFAWIGGLVGSVLPDIDHVIYILFLRPHELTSQRARQMISTKQYVNALDLLYTTRLERRQLIFHSIWFQIFFLVLTFWVLASSSNLFGRGLTLAFSLHLVVDQFIDLRQTGSLQNWFGDINVSLSKEKATIYSTVIFLLILFLAILY